MIESVITIQLSNAASAISVGSAISLTESGQAQLGGGTSIYKNIVNDLSFKCPSYLDVDAVHEDIYLVSYSDKSTSEATLVAVQVADSTPNKGEIVSTLASPYYIYETIVLSQNSGIFVSICQDFNPDVQEAFIVAGSVSTSSKITQGVPANYTTLYSVNPSIARLDDNTFAISYFSSVKPYQVMTRYGVVDPSTLEVTLSDSINYANNDDIGIYATIVGISANQYLLLFYNAYNAETGSYVASAPLNCIVATVPNNNDASAGSEELAAPSLAATQELSSVVVDIYFQATAVSNVTVILAYSDAESNSGIRAQAVTLESGGESVILGASWLVTSGEALIASENSTISDLDVATISTNGDFLVLFTDASNGGAATAVTGTITLAGEITPTSPSFVLTKASSSSADGGDDDLAEESFVWGAVSAGSKTPWGSKIAILTSITDTVCSGTTASTSFDFMEVMPKPVGIVNAKKDSSSSNVIVSGLAGSLESNLLPGMQYYANTMGALVPANVYYGRGVSTSIGANFGTSSQNYVYDEDTDTIVTFESLVGMAVSPSQLFVNLVA